MKKEKDSAVKRFLENPAHFCDLFNGSLFGGKQVLKAGSLESLPGEAIVSFADKDGRKVTVKRYRDAVRKACGNALYAIFAVEGQDKAHYAMPVREMLYDAMSYTSQVEQAALRHRENGDYQNSAQFLSGFFPEDRLVPVVTLCLYYGTTPWDGPMELLDMMDIPEEFEDMRPYLSNYRLNLIQPENAEPDNFRTDWKLIFSLLKMAGDGTGMKEYIQENSEMFRHIPPDTYDMLKALLHADRWWKADADSGKGETDMCKALEEIEEMAKQEGEILLLIKQACRKLGKGKSPEEAAEELEESVETIRKIYQAAEEFAPDYDNVQIYHRLKSGNDFSSAL